MTSGEYSAEIGRRTVKKRSRKPGPERKNASPDAPAGGMVYLLRFSGIANRNMELGLDPGNCTGMSRMGFSEPERSSKRTLF
jgi:hypothetical protein